MLPFFSERFGNPSSRTHGFGTDAARAVEAARVQVAALVGASPKEVVFTSGATEALNLAITGAAHADPVRRHLVTTAIEHEAVLDTVLALEAAGYEVTRVAPGADGVMDADAVARAVRADTLLVAIMHANNEVGTIQPVGEVAPRCRELGALLVVDAAQSAGKIPVDAPGLGADLVALSAHKLYGPKGVGALWVRRRPPARLAPLVHGGGQERGLRSGTLNVPGIVGFGAAAALALAAMPAEGERLGALRDELLARLRERVPEVRVNGSMSARLPQNLHVAFPGVEARALVQRLAATLAVSSGSACASARLETSHVLAAMGLPPGVSYSALRVGLGRWTTAEEVALAADAIADAVLALRPAPAPGK